MRHTSLFEYALIAFVVVAVVLSFAAAMWPTFELIADGFKIIGDALNGNFVPGK